MNTIVMTSLVTKVQVVFIPKNCRNDRAMILWFRPKPSTNVKIGLQTRQQVSPEVPACHLLHGQKISSQPRQLLQQIPGVKLREPIDASYVVEVREFIIYCNRKLPKN